MFQYLLIIPLIHLSICLSGQDNLLFGKYYASIPHVYKEIELKENGEFSYEEHFYYCDLTERNIKAEGTFEKKHDEISFRFEKAIHSRSEVDMEIGLKWNFDTLFNDSLIWNHVYELDSTYLYVEWNHKSFMFSKSAGEEYESFASFYNSGFEPRFSGYYFSKGKENSYSPIEKSKFPSKYRILLKEQGIRVRVKSRKLNGPYEYFYKLNKGRRDGLEENQLLYRNRTSQTIRIVEVNDKYSIGVIESMRFPVGNEYDDQPIKVGSVFYSKILKRRYR